MIGSKRFSQDRGRSLPKDRVAGARLLFDEQSFSFGGGDPAGKSGGRNEMALGRLYDAVEPATQAERAFVCRALQVTFDRCNYARLFAHRVRLRAFESGASRVGNQAGAIAKIPLEQLSNLFAV